MTDRYILAARSRESLQRHENGEYRIPSDDSAIGMPNAGTLKLEDELLVALDRGGQYDSLEPFVFRVSAIDERHLSLEAEKYYVIPVPLEKVRPILKHPLSDGLNLLQPNEFSAVVALMGTPRPSEKQLLTQIAKYVAARGYYFDDETVTNYHICLKTKPFVILAGLSGTGKSKLSQLYAEAIGHTPRSGRYLRLAVRPSWNDDRFLLGYLNTITGEYVMEPAVEFILRAEKDRDNLYFFCLDEMNLSHVEYYFSQFLSALEEENTSDRKIPLFSEATEKRMVKQGKEIDFDRSVILPPNLLFTGTINVDETTQPLSDKVIDRANTLEFFDVELDKIPERQPLPEMIRISSQMWQSYSVQQPCTTFRPKVLEISRILNHAGLGLGYRVLREIELYLANSSGLLSPEVAFDLQVKQRILPRVRGTSTIRETVRDLATFMRSNNLPRSCGRVEEMEIRLKRDGYTSFWR